MRKEHNVNRCCNLGDISVIKKEAEKILKYKYLVREIQCNVKAEVILVIIKAPKAIEILLRQYLSNILGKYKIKEL